MDIRMQAMLNAIGNLVYLIALWLLTVITTKMLGYEAAGTLTLAMAIGNIVVNFQLYGVRAFQSSDMSFRYAPNDYILARIITVVIGLAVSIVACIIIGYTYLLSLSILLFVLIKSSESFSDVLFGNIQRAGHLEIAGYSMLFRGIAILLVFFIGINQSSKLNVALLLVSICAILLTFVVDLSLHYRIIHDKVSFSLKGLYGILSECFPLFLTSIIPVFVIALPRIVLERLYGAEVLGFFGNVSSPALFLTTFIPTILTALLPTYGTAVVLRNYKKILEIWKISFLGTIALAGVCLIGSLLFVPQFLSFVYTVKILPYVHYFYFILIAMTLYALTMCNNTALIAMRKNKMVLVSSVVSLGLCVVTSLPLVRNYGISGAVAVLFISYGSQLIVQMIGLITLFQKTI